MKPIRILIFFIAVLLTLSAIALVFPEGGIQLGKDFKLKFRSLESIFKPEKVEYADISKIINQTDSLISQNDSLVSGPDRIDTIRADASQLKTNVYKLQYPPGKEDALYPFFKQLSELKGSGKLIRILHYGDSQVEGDRITSDLRFNLQSQFGGSGPGLISLVGITKTMSIKRSTSENWTRYTVFGNKDTNVMHKKYGALLNFSRFTPINNDSLPLDSVEYTAWLKLEKSNITHTNTRKFTKMRLFYGYNKMPFTVSLFDQEEELVQKDSVPPSSSASTLIWEFDQAPEALRLEFKSKDGPDIYGLALDNDAGIAVDNIPLRGSAGLDFAKTDLNFLRKMYTYLNVKCLILEFGVNVVPNVVEDYSFYESWFYSNLKALKALDPELCIIVIGLSDMARKTESGDYYESYPNIELIRDAQKNAAFRAGCAFWDMYEAMGGKNSMPAWVFAEPPLAGKDFTHFNARGARIISQMFYNALIHDYRAYLNRNKN